MTKLSIILAGGSALFAFSASATPTSPGTPLTVSPGSLNANGNVKAVFLYVAAADTSNLDFVGGSSNPIFINKGPGANSPGDTVNLGTQSGIIQFTLNNLTAGTSYTNDLADLDGYYHAFYSTNAITTNAATNDFNVSFSQAAIDAVAALTGTVTIVGFEDRNSGRAPNYDGQPSDWDYNDLIYAFSATRPTPPPPVPEPAALALFGLGLAGIALGRRRAR